MNFTLNIRLHQQQKNGKMPGKSIWIRKVYRIASDGTFLVDDNKQGRVTLLSISDKEEWRILMIIQPEWGSRNVNESFYESEARRIDMLNEIFGDVELSRTEMQTLVWLAGWEESTVKNVVSAIKKVMSI